MIYNEDIIEWAKKYDGEKFHALLCDPPYHLTSIVKRFGKKDSAPAKFGTDGVYSRSSRGFMGTTWDGGDVAFRPETWATIMPVLHDGAFGMAFAASRNWHRLAVAIEDAGFVIHPTLFGWAYGSGFPKATRVKDERFSGHRYGLQALKPALEPIIVFQKPYAGRPLDNILETGAGTLNIDEARIETEENRSRPPRTPNKIYGGGNGTNLTASESNPLGRWPSNLLLMDEVAVDVLDKQTGVKKGGFVRNRTAGARVFNNNGKDTGYTTDEVIEEMDGGASRFFFQVQDQLDEADPAFYCAKANRTERDAGLVEMPLKDIRPLGISQWEGQTNGSGEKMGASSPARNPHPTVKPIGLSTYLAKLLLPPIDYAPRRLLVPFSGVASEMIGGYLAGFEEVVGVEFDKENGYVDIAEKRIEYWTNKAKKETQLGLL